MSGLALLVLVMGLSVGVSADSTCTCLSCFSDGDSSEENNVSDVELVHNSPEVIEIEVDCFHYGHCQICDEYADYHCSPYGSYPGYGGHPWLPCPFSDPVPSGNIVTKIEATIMGVAAPLYGGTEKTDVLINNVLVGSGTMIGEDKCGTCYPLTVASPEYTNGFPGYVYGGTNQLYLDIDGVSCISDVHLKLYYSPRSDVEITILATEPIIPTESRVQDGNVLYESTLTITAINTTTSDPVPDLSIQVHSDRSQDTIIQPTEPTNDRGTTTARIQTREKGTATITATTSDVDAIAQPTTIEFNDANYEHQFRITGYIIADENDFSGPTVTDPCGLTGTYYRRFLYSGRGVLMQGSGRTRDGRYIQIDWTRGGPRGANTCFREVDFPTTASGVPLEPMVTIAVDPSIIPLGSDVDIEGIGTRTAQDTGGRIVGYHIDVYVGVGQSAMAEWNNRQSTVRYLDP